MATSRSQSLARMLESHFTSKLYPVAMSKVNPHPPPPTVPANMSSLKKISPLAGAAANVISALVAHILA